MFVKVSCPFFCVYSFKELSLMGKRICRLKLNLLVKLSACFHASIVIRKVEIVSILDWDITYRSLTFSIHISLSNVTWKAILTNSLRKLRNGIPSPQLSKMAYLKISPAWFVTQHLKKRVKMYYFVVSSSAACWCNILLFNTFKFLNFKENPYDCDK